MHAMEIPLIEAGRRGAAALVDAMPREAAALLATALGAHPLLPRVARLGDAVSRRWLERHRNPYRTEIDEIARRLGRPGVYLLNCVYEWACSTSVGPDPCGTGSRMIRVLDWGMPGIGRYLVVARHETAAGGYFAAAWPGYAGVLTGMAPGRFAAALNQAPRQHLTGVPLVDGVAARLRMLHQGGLPPAHLLRQVFEAARDYEGALAMLADPLVAVAMPALVTLAGTEPHQAAIIELAGRSRAVHPARQEESWIVGVANDWLSPWSGTPRLHAHLRRPGETPRGNNAERRRLIRALQHGAFAGAAALPVPVLNAHSVLVWIANARRGTLRVEALDRGSDGLPRVVAGPLDIAA
jgi:hypothetical protein